MISAQKLTERPRLAINEFSRRLGDYKRWRDELIEIINEYQTWVESHGLASGEEDLQLYELIDALRSDKLTIALVAEFSRGKTELINAIINYPHPLLKRGLVVLDTPGLNALGTEPELTLSMLPGAQAVLFVLAADTGVTKTDLEVWRNHVCPARGSRAEGRLVALNKIDTLWDELSNDTAITAAIARQTQETARVLGISKNQVIAVSAQKGLLGKIKSDYALIERSGFPGVGKQILGEYIPGR